MLMRFSCILILHYSQSLSSHDLPAHPLPRGERDGLIKKKNSNKLKYYSIYCHTL